MNRKRLTFVKIRGLLILGLGLVGFMGATGCDRIPQICEDSCKQEARCNPSFDDYGYSIRACRSDCEDSYEDQVREVEADCKSAFLDYWDCVANRSCNEVNSHDYTACDQESLRLEQRCESQ